MTNCFLALAALATQGVASADPHVDVQVDPTPFFLRGFAPEVGAGIGGHRVYATVVAYDVPKFLREDEAFDERRDYRIGLGYQYFLRGRFTGPFVGASALWTHSTFTRADLVSSASAEVGTLAATARLGWVIYPFAALPHLLFGPWISAAWSFAPDEPSIEGRRIDRRVLGFTAALQLGWRFDLGGAR